MAEALKTSSPTLTALAGAFRRIRSRMGELGVNVSVWDLKAHWVAELAPSLPFCNAVCDACMRGGRAGSDGPCAKAGRQAARRIVAEEKPVIARSKIGCFVMAVPVRCRRRLVGATVACYPSLEMLDEEHLARVCDRLGVDREVMGDLAREACRRRGDDAEQLMRILEWFLQDQQALEVTGGELTTLSTNLANTYEELSLVYAISGSIRITREPREFLQRVCDELLEVMNLEGVATVAYAQAPSQGGELVVTAGRLQLDDAQIKLLVTELSPRFARSTRSQVDNNFVPPTDGRLGRHIGNLVAVPLVADEGRIGMIVGINKLSGEFNSVDMKLISSIANQVSVFLRNNKLYADLQDLLMGVLHALTASIDAKDPYTCGHSQRVARISKRLAQECGFSESQAERMYLAGLLHDIGKIGVPENILRKDGRLTEDEYDVIKRHPALGASILGGIRQLKDMIVGIQTHHERIDGAGYPSGVSGSEVPIEGLILGLADAFDAMTSDRTYRKAFSVEEAIEEIKEHTGTQFAPKVVEAFLAVDWQAYLAELRQGEAAGVMLQGGCYGEPEQWT